MTPQDTQHVLLSKDVPAGTGVCACCGPVDLKKLGKKWRCGEKVRAVKRKNNASRKARGIKPRASGYRAAKGGRCERCGFLPLVRDQLCVHHRDEDHGNNAPDNLQTLCLNCHALTHHELRRAA